ncbi:MAG: helix-turn-helix domain-containing protein [Mangrovibacterium sp.]
MRLISATELKTAIYGEVGTPRRDAFEEKIALEIKTELLIQQLKEERQRQQITKKELGEKLGVKKSYISSIEKARRKVSMKVLTRIAHALGFEIDYTLSPLK